METVKIFKSGNSQAVRIPKKYRLKDSEAYLRYVDGMLIIIPKSNNLETLKESIKMFSSDFMSERDQQSIQEREEIFS